MRLFSLVLFLLLTSPLYSNNHIDSLLNEAKNNFNKDWEKSTELIELAHALSETKNYKLGIIRAIQYKGWIEYKSGDIGKGVRHFLEVVELTENQTDSALLHFEVYACLNLGKIFNSNHLSDLAIEYERRGILVANSIGYVKPKISLLKNLQRAYRSAGDFQKSIEVNHELLLIVSKDSDDYLEGLNGLGIAYQFLENYDLARFYYSEMLQQARKQQSRRKEIFALHNLGDVLFNENQLEQSTSYFNQVLSLLSHEDKPDPMLVGNGYRDLARSQLHLNQNKAAYDNITLAIDYLKVSGCLDCLSSAYQVKNNVLHLFGSKQEMISFQKDFAAFEDQTKTEALRVKYESRQPELRMIVSNYYSELESQRKIDSSRRALISGIIGVSLLLLLVSAYHIYTRFKARRLIAKELEGLNWEEY